jgi:hypothetical protein
MKIFTFLAAIFLTLPLFGQQDSLKNDTIKNIKVEYKDSIGTFKWDIGGLTDFITMQFDTLISSKDLYSQTINWIKETYKMPDKVIQTTIENDLVRIEGISKDALTINSSLLTASYDLKYTIEFRFKESKVKIDPIELFVYVPPSQYNLGGWQSFPIDSGINFYKYNKKTKMYELMSKFQSYPEELSGLYNGLSISLFNYLKSFKEGDSKEVKKNSDDW